MEADVVVTRLIRSHLLHAFSTHGFQNPSSPGSPWNLIDCSFLGCSEVFPSSCCRDPGLNPLSFLPLVTHSLGDLIQSHAFTNTYQHLPCLSLQPKSMQVNNRSVQLNRPTDTHLPSQAGFAHSFLCFSWWQLWFSSCSGQRTCSRPWLFPFSNSHWIRDSIMTFNYVNPLAWHKSNPASPTSYNCTTSIISYLSSRLFNGSPPPPFPLQSLFNTAARGITLKHKWNHVTFPYW